MEGMRRDTKGRGKDVVFLLVQNFLCKEINNVKLIVDLLCCNVLFQSLTVLCILYFSFVTFI